MRRLSLLLGLALSALFSFASVTTVSGAELLRPKRVLIISMGSRLAPGFILVDQPLLQALANIPSVPVETYAENLDLARFPSAHYGKIFREYLTGKYAANPPDLVILVYVGTLGTPGQLLRELFPRTPIIVAGLTEEEFRADQFGTLVSGVAQRINPRATLELILRLQPELRRVVVIGGTAEIDRQVLQRVKDAAQSIKGRVEIAFWDNLTMAELRQSVTMLPPGSAILFARMFLDAASQAFISSEVGQWIGRSANVPVYVMTDASFGTGAVGGSLASVEAFGKRAGEMARLILTGTLPVALPFEIRTDSVPTFDGRALKRWNISEGRLPANSVVRFRPESLWEQYRWYILGGLIILAQSAIIANLFLQRRRVSYVKTKLQESQQLMELATSGAELGLWSRDLRNGDLAANAPARSLFGFGPTDRLRYDEMLARVHPNDRTRMQSEIERTAAIGQPFQGEFRTVLPGGTERWVLAKGRTVVERGRHDGHRMGVLLDITERKRAEEALRETEGRLARTEEFSLVMVTHTDLEGRWLKVPPTLCKLLGYTERELLGRRFHELTHPDDLKGNVEQRLRLLRGEIKSFDIEKRYIRKDGGIVWVYVNVSIVTDAKDNPIHCLSYIRDITERKRAEEALRESEGLRRAIFESQPVCVKLVAPDYRLLDMNPAGLAMIEADCLRQVVGQSVMAIIVPEWHATYENLHRRVCRGESAVAQFEIIGLKGKRRWMESHAAPLRSKDGDIIALVAISHDISDRKRAEQDLEEALSEVKRLKEQLEVENVYLRSEVSGVHRYGEIIGASEGIQKVFEQVDRVAPTDMTVLILGETGTGKELVARLVHEKSARSERPLVKVNCSTLPAELIESELFGHERGAFTGAVSKQVGRFELADGGTIFLDEVGEVPLRLQSKLLRVLQEGEFERLGSGKTIKVDVRMIAATNRNLSEAAQRGRFRADLYYRLNVYPIELPPLRDRRGDIGLLSEVFLNEATRRLGKSFGKIPNEVIEALRAYSWPGNVRELENVISRAAVLSTAAALQLPEGWNKAPVTGLSCTPFKTIPEPLSLRSESPQSMPTLEQFERTRILEVLDQTNWRIEGPKGAAMILGLHPNTLRSRLRKLGITKAPKLRNSVETTK